MLHDLRSLPAIGRRVAVGRRPVELGRRRGGAMDEQWEHFQLKCRNGVIGHDDGGDEFFDGDLPVEQLAGAFRDVMLKDPSRIAELWEMLGPQVETLVTAILMKVLSGEAVAEVLRREDPEAS